MGVLPILTTLQSTFTFSFNNLTMSLIRSLSFCSKILIKERERERRREEREEGEGDRERRERGRGGGRGGGREGEGEEKREREKKEKEREKKRGRGRIKKRRHTVSACFFISSTLLDLYECPACAYIPIFF